MWDGYVYLVYSYSVLSGEKLFLDKIRSPLLSLVIPPDLELARIANCIYFLLLSIFVFLIVKKLTKNSLLALFGGILVGTNPYLLFFTKYTMSDLPAILFFMIGLYFFFENKKIAEVLSGIFFGFSFVFRPDIGILLIPLFLFKIRDIMFFKYCFSSFLFISVLLNFLVSYFVFNRWIYPPLEFLLINFITEKMAFNTQTTVYTDYLWFFKNFAFFNIAVLPFLLFSIRWIKEDKNYTTLFITFVFLTVTHLFLPKIDARIYITKATPLAAILASYAFKSEKKKDESISSVLIIIIAAIAFLRLSSILDIDPIFWRVDKIEYKQEGTVCSNFPFAYIYFTKRGPCHMIKYFDIPIEKRNILWLVESINSIKCDYVYIFTYRDTPITFNEIEFIKNNFNISILNPEDTYPVYEVKLK